MVGFCFLVWGFFLFGEGCSLLGGFVYLFLIDQVPFSPSQASCIWVTPHTQDNRMKQVLEFMNYKMF